MNFQFGPIHQDVLTLARDFVNQTVRPRIEIHEREATFPSEIMAIAAKLGLTGIIIPEEYGGAGLDTLALALVVEEISKVSPALALIICANNSLSGAPIIAYGNEEQKKKYLPLLARGEYYGCYAMTEPDAGSDVANLQARALLEGDTWMLSGTKTLITNGSVADVIVGIFRTGPNSHKGLSAFIIETTTPGFKVQRVEKKMGLSCSPTAELFFDTCHIPRENLLGAEGDGFKIAMQTMNGGRVYIAAQALGIAEGALNLALQYAKSRNAFGKPLSEHQALQHKLANMATNIEAARSLVYRTCTEKDSGASYIKLASMSKLFATEMACSVVYDALQIFGGMGYIQGNRIERLYRDVRALPIYEGTSEIQLNIIADAIIHNKFE